MVTALLRRSSTFAVLAIAPLLLTAAAWGLWNGEPASVMEAPVPVGPPTAGLRASLMDIYWRAEQSHYFSVLANVSKPAFTMSYALVFVVLVHGARARRRSWLSVITLAALIGFLGLASSTLAPIALVLWAGLEAIHLIQSRRARSLRRSDAIRPASGLALAALLLLAGGFSTLILDAPVTSGLSLGTGEQFGGWRLLGRLDRLPGGIGILGLGPLAVAGAALLLARRDRLVQALAAGTGALLLASLLLSYEPFPFNLVRLEGHARNFALVALVLALGFRLTRLRPAPWRYVAGGAIVALIHLADDRCPRPATSAWRSVTGSSLQMLSQRSSGDICSNTARLDRIPTYIRNHTAAGARVFSPHPHQMTYVTGRPNALGFAGLVHLEPKEGPAYRDVVGFPRAGGYPPARLRICPRARRVGRGVARRGGRAAQRSPPLRAPDSRHIPRASTACCPRFSRSTSGPRPRHTRPLRRAVPASATVFVSAISESRPSAGAPQPLLSSGAVRALRLAVVRTARALSHARLLGVIDQTTLQLRTPWRAEPLARPHARPRYHAAGFRALDVSSRLAAAGLAERRNRRLRA